MTQVVNLGLKDFSTTGHTKLSPLYKVPYRVLRKVGDVLCQLRFLGGGEPMYRHFGSTLTFLENVKVEQSFPIHEQGTPLGEESPLVEGEPDGETSTKDDDDPGPGKVL